ncbi:MAG TPA: hypothetical protein VFI09_03560 [Solirubrobacterales bacterium]|nr:hypothetical protein [Solirubrobacterales bacterium]
MSSTPGEQPRPDSDAEFAASHFDKITEANWQEMKAQGFIWIDQQVDLDTPEGQHSLKTLQRIYGPENVFTGSAFDGKEGRPLDNKPGRGIYVTGEAFWAPDEGEDGTSGH